MTLRLSFTKLIISPMERDGLITRTQEPGRPSKSPIAENMYNVPVHVDLDPKIGTVTFSSIVVYPKGRRGEMRTHIEPDNPTPVDEVYFPLRGPFYAITSDRHCALHGTQDLREVDQVRLLFVEDHPTLQITDK
ncbi:MAG: hypothetical protein ACMG6E_02120, partial [Candidatus Roizmanbacteria bacterium]